MRGAADGRAYPEHDAGACYASPMRPDRRRFHVVVLAACALAAACGGTELLSTGPTDAGLTVDATSVSDAAFDSSRDSGPATACIPGQSVGCVGPGGCSSTRSATATVQRTGPCDGGSVAYAASDTYALSAFGGDGLATGQMNTDQGIIPLVVKACP